MLNAQQAVIKEFDEPLSFGVNLHAIDMFQKALPKIYVDGSMMNALTSVDAAAVSRAEPADFLKWLAEQRASSREEVTQISIEELKSIDSRISKRLPPSRVVKPGGIDLNLSSEARGRIDGMVLLGGTGQRTSDAGAPLSPVISTVGKLCDGNGKLPVGRDVTHRKQVRIVCLDQASYGNPWIIFFCDPNDCTTPEDSAAALAEIRSSIEGRNIATSSELIAQHASRGGLFGPYLLNTRLPNDR